MEANFGAALKITDKKHSDGLRSGMTVVTMKNLIFKATLFQVTLKLVVAKNVTYQGKVIPCKYCGDAGHVQSECHKRATDFPAPTRSKPCDSSAVLPETNVHPEPVNLSRKERSQSVLDKTDSVSTTSSIKI